MRLNPFRGRRGRGRGRSSESWLTGRADKLAGMKENVIIGRLFPVGTGYRETEKTEEK